MNNGKEILERLEKVYHGARPALNFESPYQLLTATILSAQCTDVRVNMVTEGLFKKYPDAYAMAGADEKELGQDIHSCGFYVVKAQHLIGACSRIVSEYDGNVPDTMEELLTLPGVGRKTANVVLSNAFGVPAIAVDTHVFRVSNRLGLAHADNVEKTEEQLMAAIPREQWGDAHHWLIYHGRQVCASRKPACDTCFLSDICPYAANNREKGATG